MNNELKYLKENDFFDVDAFKAYLEEQFPEPMKSPFTRGLIDNILDEAAQEYNYEDGQFLTRLVDMIPELTWSEVIRFADPLMIDTLKK